MGQVILFPAQPAQRPAPEQSGRAATLTTGQRLRLSMKHHHCSNEMLAKHARVSRQAVQKWCSGDASIPLNRLMDAAARNERCRRVVVELLQAMVEIARAA